ncbi:TNT domain-containing protein [Sciscionella sediminilitoris]|uniref:TNT domain-containing protein n=1 Tax=Sciscionella sediminilitoris TaxID=1445613 RepID=UPI00056081E0|nr:TNT domain-containing protein [Sciscionella sp. SE31]
MSQPTTADSNALIKQIGITLINAAPQDWQQIRTEFRATGRYYELSAEIVNNTGATNAWTASHAIALMFARLRAAMHPIEGGTWFNARYHIERPSKYNVEFDRDEPQWRTQPPPQAFRDELRYFPREEADVPDWLMMRMSGISDNSAPPAGEAQFRVARIFDGKGPNGRPTVNRPPVPEQERDQLRQYLDRARLILPVRGNDVDHLSSDGQQSVPIAFHSDGVWIWPAAVNYYFARYGLPPEPGLVEHARASQFAAPDLEDSTAEAAARMITGGRPPGPPVRQGATPPPEPPEPARTSGGEIGAQLRAKLEAAGVPAESYRIGEFVPGTWHLLRTPDGWLVARPDPANPAPMRFAEEHDAAAFMLGKLLLDRPAEASRPETAPDAGAAPAAAALPVTEQADPEPVHAAAPVPQPEPTPVAAALEAEPIAAQVESELAPAEPAEPEAADSEPASDAPGPAASAATEPETAEPETAEPGTTEPETAEPEATGHEEAEPGEPEQTGSAEESSEVAVPAGSAEGQHEAADQEPPAQQAESEAPRHAAAAEPEEPEAPGEPEESEAALSPSDLWKRWRLSDDPPGELFRNKARDRLTPGTTVDRYGEPDGGLVHLAGTPFEERSLPGEWAEREVRTYRVSSEIEVLSGTAIPWFDQPGGGTGYLLPKPITELLADGALEQA